ncbi:hypothetical protein MMC22_001185 [Lobaria immixta]|nr:hypothetical protein [Lobaria immixta]
MIPIADPSLIDIDELTESSLSAGKKAICTTRIVKVTITSTNTKLRLPEPDSQMSATETVQELIQANATIIARLSDGKQTFTDTYSIGSKLCYPVNDSAHKSRTVQVLTHGMGLDKSYWDIAPGYSYVDAAAAAGYATLSYDRLGVGLSDHPDPIQVVQSHVDLEVLHALVQLLRSGELTAQTFKTVIGVGHSYGSIIKIGVAAKYPKDFDAIITTGFAPEIQELGYTMVANNPTIAKLDQPTQFGHLSSGYFVHNSAQSIRLPFYRYPYYDLDAFNSQVAAKQTYALGQLFTIFDILQPATSFTGPVNVVLGQYDFPFCRGDCTYPVDQSAAVKPAFFPAANAGSQEFLVPETGHNINGHYKAPAVFDQINRFLSVNGFH